MLELLASYCSVADAKELARTLEPVSTLVEANALINQTSAAHALMAKQGAPSFGGIKNVRSSLSRAAAGSMPAVIARTRSRAAILFAFFIYPFSFGSPDAARDFQRRVDSTTVYANASTCFTDGAEFGMAADLGSSTDKAGPRGAIGPEAFTGLKYVATGDGQTRGGA